MSVPGLLHLVLLLVTVEAAGLLALRRAMGRGPAPAALLANLAAGGALLLAFRVGAGGFGVVAVSACLGVALLAHVADLRQRWQR